MIEIALFGKTVPRTVKNFVALATHEVSGRVHPVQHFSLLEKPAALDNRVIYCVGTCFSWMQVCML